MYLISHLKIKLQSKEELFYQELQKINATLQRLQKLQQLQRLEQLKDLSISNLSYENVIIDTPEDETILYLDPPYHGTASYNSTLDFKKLKTFIKESKFKIYLSEYKNTYDLKLVKEFKHRSILSPSSNNEVIEKLYCNK